MPPNFRGFHDEIIPERDSNPALKTYFIQCLNNLFMFDLFNYIV